MEIDMIQRILQDIIDGKLFGRDFNIYTVKNISGTIRHVQFNALDVQCNDE
jgi:hypothetical protein